MGLSQENRAEVVYAKAARTEPYIVTNGGMSWVIAANGWTVASFGLRKDMEACANNLNRELAEKFLRDVYLPFLAEQDGSRFVAGGQAE